MTKVINNVYLQLFFVNKFFILTLRNILRR